MEGDQRTALANFLSALAGFLSDVAATGIVTYIALLLIGFAAGYGFFNWQRSQRREARHRRHRQRKLQAGRRGDHSDSDGSI